MNWFYNLALRLTSFFLRIIALFHPKVNQFVQGRKGVFDYLANNFGPEDKVIWIHTASLGEYEQGLPVIQHLRKSFGSYKLLVTFFSPSGYEVKKGSTEAHGISYLPLDTISNVNRFLDIVNPALAIFVKYEVWPNYYSGLGRRGIPLLLISARFTKKQVFFKWYGGFLRKALDAASHIFVQDQKSLEMIHSIGIENVSISGDTRFDRVSQILERDNSLSFMDRFKKDRLCFVGGSTWPEDEALLVPFINQAPPGTKFVLAPHDVKGEHISKLMNSISRRIVLYSEAGDSDLEEAEVLIIDTIGLLTKIYSYADIAYVGGGFATGLHNTLEPAVFGIPVIIGPNYLGFREAFELVERKGLLVTANKDELETAINKLLTDPAYRQATGKINASYVRQHGGASIQIMDYIRSLLVDQ